MLEHLAPPLAIRGEKCAVILNGFFYEAFFFFVFSFASCSCLEVRSGVMKEKHSGEKTPQKNKKKNRYFEKVQKRLTTPVDAGIKF